MKCVHKHAWLTNLLKSLKFDIERLMRYLILKLKYNNKKYIRERL